MSAAKLPSSLSVISCPECKDKMRCNDTLENFLVKVVEKDDQGNKGEGEKKKHMCACGEGEEAQEGTSFCKDCAEWLCEECVQAHRRVRLTRDHTIKSGEEALETETVLNTVNELGLEICKRHPGEKSQFFCEACEMLTCRDCQLLEHKDHKYSFLNVASESYRGRLVDHLEQLKRNKEKLVKLLSLLQQKTAQVSVERELDWRTEKEWQTEKKEKFLQKNSSACIHFFWGVKILKSWIKPI